MDSEKVVSHKSKTTIEGSSRTKNSLNATKSTPKTSSSDNEFLSILETPQIRRKSPANRNKLSIDTSSISSNYFTPTSILKVKQLMRRSTSPSSLASSPVSTTRLNSSKTLQSTPLQHKLRFSVPEKVPEEMPYPCSEDSVENARLAAVKDTFMLKLKGSSKSALDLDESFEMEVTDRIELSTVIEIAEESKTYTTETYLNPRKRTFLYFYSS